VGVCVGLTLTTAVGAGDRPRVQAGSERWIIAHDLPPFTLKGSAIELGGTGMREFLPAEPENLRAGAEYADAARGMRVGVSVVRQADPTHLEHLIESDFRSHDTGHRYAEAEMVDIDGNTVLSYLEPRADPKDRSYAWRSGAQVAVRVEAKAFVDVGSAESGPDPRRAPCPDPREVVRAYLERYPSSLERTRDSGARAHAWLRERVGIHLEELERQLDEVPALPESRRRQALFDVRRSMLDWAVERERVFGGPQAAPFEERLARITPEPVDAQLRDLGSLRREYREWWNEHRGDGPRRW
jgi:hypothetical protein